MKIFKKGGFQELFWSMPLVNRLLHWSKTHSFIGFSNVPIYDVVLFILQEIRRDSIVTRANSIAYSFFLSLFPTLLMFFTLIPFILPYFQGYIIPFINEEFIAYDAAGVVDFNQTIIAQFQELMALVNVIPTTVQVQLIDFIESILLEPRFGLLSIGFILAIFFSSNGMLEMMRGFEKNNKNTFMRRNVIVKRLIAIELTFLIGLLVFVAIFFIILGNTAITWLFGIIHVDGIINNTIRLLRIITVFFLFYFGISFIYRRGIPMRQKMPYFSVGTTLATMLTLTTSWVFALYVNNYSKYNDLYGSIGTFIVIMLWIQINASILLIGFELNASIAVNRDLNKRVDPSHIPPLKKIKEEE